jgi:hypothetical protein
MIEKSITITAELPRPKLSKASRKIVMFPHIDVVASNCSEG